MFIQVVKSKIHRVTVTGANLDYIGSITIDQDLLDAAGIVEGERVFIVDNNNGERLDTYVIPGERGKGEVCLNGAAARKVQPGDVVIIMSYALMTPEEAKGFKPMVVHFIHFELYIIANSVYQLNLYKWFTTYKIPNDGLFLKHLLIV